jgi:sigma-B regulation protein RsbU (phosphoserine phosphatase)
VSGADRGFIMLAGPGGGLEFSVGRGRGRVTLTGQTFQTSSKIPEEVFATDQARIVSNLVEGDLAETHLATIALGIRQVLCVPLRLMRYVDQPAAVPANRPIGVLYLDSRASSTLLSETTRLGVEALAAEAAVAIENARLYKETLEKARVDQELRIAADMQRALRPAPRYAGPHFEVASASQPSRFIGGDFFDYVELPGGVFGLALGDVAGKGPPAAVLAAALQGMFAAYASDRPAETLARVNVTLARHFVDNRFATMVYGVLSPEGRLTYCNAGHNPPILFMRGEVRRLEQGGMPLGMFPEAAFLDEALRLAAGDVLLVFSDGVSEAVNGAGDAFGDERITACMQANLGADASVLLERLLAEVQAFSSGAVQQDDVTALVLRMRP